MSFCVYKTNTDCREQKILCNFIKFQPLLRKYTRKLRYDGSETDLTIALIHIIDKMPPLESEPKFIKYIDKSLHHEYIRLLKKANLINKTETPLEMTFIDNHTQIDLDLKLDLKDALKKLPSHQK